MGKFGVQWAKVAGIGTVIAVASLSHEKELKDMGATHVIDRHSSSIVQDIQEIAGGKDAVTHIYDCVNWTVSGSSLHLMKPPSSLTERILTPVV